MAEDDDSFRVDSIFKENQVRSYDEVHQPKEREEKNEQRKQQKRRSGDFFETLAKRAEVTNKELEAKKLPFRFCVYQKGNNVFWSLWMRRGRYQRR